MSIWAFCIQSMRSRTAVCMYALWNCASMPAVQSSCVSDGVLHTDLWHFPFRQQCCPLASYHRRFVPRHRRSMFGRLAFSVACHLLSLNSMGPTPTPTSSPTPARGSSCGSRRVRRLPRSACHERDTHDNPRRLVRRLDRHTRGALFLARILARLSVRDARVHTCKRVL